MRENIEMRRAMVSNYLHVLLMHSIYDVPGCTQCRRVSAVRNNKHTYIIRKGV